MSQRAATYLALCLIDAIEDSNLDALRLLLAKHRANPNTVIPEKEVAPIHLVIGAEHEPFAERATSLMLQFGGNANLPSVEQRLTPLHVAASLGRAAIARLLLEAGGDVELLDDEDRTPIQHAIEEGHYEVLALLKNHVFEQKIERRRKKLLQEQEQQQQQLLCPPVSEMSSLLASPSMRLRKGFAEKMAPLSGKTLSALQELDENVLTPNKIHYNFDVTSPYYVNITHRRKAKHGSSVSHMLFPPDGQENSTPPAAAGGQCDDDDDGGPLPLPPPVPVRTNLFELTERNLRNFTRDDDERRGDRRRSSFIECWREQIAEVRDRNRISRRMDDIERILASFTENPNQTAYLDAVEDSFRTAQQEEMKPATDSDLPTRKQEPELEQDQVNEEIPKETLQDDGKGDDAPEQEVCEVIQILDSSHEEEDGPLNDHTITSQSPPSPPPPQSIPQIQITADTVAAWSFPEKRNPSITSQSTAVTLPPLDYDTDALRAELTQYGEPPGPITKHTKKLYLRKLIKCRRHPERVTAAASARALGTKNYSVELMATIRREETFGRITEDHQPLEQEMASEFQTSNGARARQFREGHQKKSFIYLLLDPRITDNLPAQQHQQQQQQQQNRQHELWKCFLSAVFYVGKGKSSRPYNHLHDALKLYRPPTGTGNPGEEKPAAEEDDGGMLLVVVDEEELVGQCLPEKASTKIPTVTVTREGAAAAAAAAVMVAPTAEAERSDSHKLNRILDIWAAGKGVVCLHVFHNIMPAEAYSREAAIIDAIGLGNLTNLKRGDYYGKCVSWPLKRRKQLGILLLWKAFLIYLAEGETQLLPGDLV